VEKVYVQWNFILTDRADNEQYSLYVNFIHKIFQPLFKPSKQRKQLATASNLHPQGNQVSKSEAKKPF